MTEGHRPERVRVTGPERRRTHDPRSRDIDSETRLGGVYLTSLLREQRWLAIRVLTTLTLTLGALPLLFFLAPALGRVEVAGVPVSWVLLGVLAYPLLWLLGWRYVRQAERIEADFADLVGEAEPGREPT